MGSLPFLRDVVPGFSTGFPRYPARRREKWQTWIATLPDLRRVRKTVAVRDGFDQADLRKRATNGRVYAISRITAIVKICPQWNTDHLVEYWKLTERAFCMPASARLTNRTLKIVSIKPSVYWTNLLPPVVSRGWQAALPTRMRLYKKL